MYPFRAPCSCEFVPGRGEFHMKPQWEVGRWKRIVLFYMVILALAAIYTGFISTGSILGQAAVSNGGTISGLVTADQGEVHALRVKVRDAERHITYTVFTN